MSTNINRIVHLAYEQEGIKEGIGNQVKYNDEFYGGPTRGENYHWCAVFVWWLFKHTNMLAAIDYLGPTKATAVAAFRDKFESRKVALEDVKAGDLMILKHPKGGGHMGIVVEDYDPATKSVFTIEGNTGPDGSVGQADRNGEGVYLKRRSNLPPKGYESGFYARPFYERLEDFGIPAVGQPMDEFPLPSGWVFAKGGYQSYNGKDDGYAAYY